MLTQFDSNSRDIGGYDIVKFVTLGINLSAFYTTASKVEQVFTS